MTVTSVYAAVLALLFVGLSVRTIRLRRRARVAIGDGGDPQLARAMRVHANFAEYVPLALLLIYFAESGGLPRPAVHLLCALLLAGRLAHAWGVSQPKEDFRFRIAGMAMTFVVLGMAALAVLVRAGGPDATRDAVPAARLGPAACASCARNGAGGMGD